MNRPTIISGFLKGSKLEVNESTTRPLTSRVKQSIFDTISAYITSDAKVLDLYAGSGSFGIEAISRGVVHVDFIERNEEAVSLLKQNLSRLNIPTNQYTILKSGVAHEVKKSEQRTYDIVFIDAPFEETHKVPIDSIILITKLDGLIIWKVPSDFKIEKELKRKGKIAHIDTFGKNSVIFIRPTK